MVRLNKTHLQDKQLQNLMMQFAKVISPKEPQHASKVLTEILGTEEQVMIAKRLATIVLLSEGFSTYKISQTLKLSKSTVSKVSKKLSDGEYEEILGTLGKDKKNYFAILEAIDNVLHLGGILPHYNGLDRYRGL